MDQELLMQKAASTILLEGYSQEDLVAALKLLDNPETLAYTHPPVDFVTFVESPYYLNRKGILYPEVMRCGAELNSGLYEEAVLTGGIGTGKTTLALYTTAYQLYLLSCYQNPQKSFGLDPSSEIEFVFQNINAKLAKAVEYERFKSLIQESTYFREYFPFDRTILSELLFPNRVIVKPVSGLETGSIGQNVIGGIIDELNFMAIVEKSGGDSSTYNQATSLYNSIARRRESRFMQKGRMPGLLCLTSSKRYPGQFTDKKTEQARMEIERYGKTKIYVYDKKVWEVKPAENFTGQWFHVFCGDEFRRPYVIETQEQMDAIDPNDEHLVLPVPLEYKPKFEEDILNSLRDIGGVSTLASAPFIMNRNAIFEAMRDDHIAFSQNAVDFVRTKLLIHPKQLIRPELPRWVHIDLALTGDSAGVCIGTVTDFKSIVTVNDTVELLPNIWIDAALEVVPPRNGEILFYKIREVLYALSGLGLNIRWVSFDQYQSRDSMQLLRQKGYVVGQQSVDTSTSPYEFVKNALYSGRLSIPNHPKLAYELSSLERDIKRKRIDHPSHSSKDVSDALAGVVYGLTMRREVWALHNITLGQIPESVRNSMTKDKKVAQDGSPPVTSDR